MIFGLAGALVAAVCYGAATVLQAVGIRRLALTPVDPGPLSRVWAGRLYAVGLALDAVGFLASLAALRTLPLFVVQSAIASSVAVTVILAVVFLGARLRRAEVVALLVIGVGLLALAASASVGQGVVLSRQYSWLVLAGVVPVALLAAAAFLVPGVRAAAPSRTPVVLLSLAAGLGFGGVGVAARVIVVPHPWWQLLGDPVVWALAGYAVLSLAAYALALARGSVTVVAALTFGVETVVPAAIGLLWLGDRVRPGLAAVAVLGFFATVGGCVALAGRAEVTASDAGLSSVPDA